MYTIEQLSTITGLTTRTLRNYLKSGILRGNKENGVWKFTDQQVSEFAADPAVQPSIRTKCHNIVYDFLAGQEQTENEMCILLDRSIEEEKAKEIADFFCKSAGTMEHFRFSYSYGSGKAHFILKGPEDQIRRFMENFYREF